MHWISMIGIALAANLDNLGIGVSFGARSTRVPFISNLVIAILSMIAAYLSITLGMVISQYVPSNYANWGGGALIILIGIYAVISDYKSNSKIQNENGITSYIHSPNKADKDNNKVISWKESLTLGVALALNCVVGGFGAGVTGLSPIMTTLFIGLFSLLTVDIGVRAGQQIAKTLIGKWFNLLGGVLLICIGLYEMFV
ncbi:manganese efflux pump [Paenibacillus planticolens]|uniref:Sporulation membrane protein YtaF n=1 Tax=Paenibacillus planticolens TaxID=2654976 RepID=A0ABX1ZFI6_9BACL|nr:manganese efflux pump [Paenibacillus planticolens]NOU98846.1 sporulation membrane protein YtaF [Paenibacillus planticolens]